MPFAYGALTHYGTPFQNASARHQFCNSGKGSGAPSFRSRNPDMATPPGYSTRSVWADPVSLAATQGVTVVFLSSGY